MSEERIFLCFVFISLSLWCSHVSLQCVDTSVVVMKESSPFKYPNEHSTLKKVCIVLNWNSASELPAIWNYKVLSATRPKWMCPALAPSVQAGTLFTYPGGMEGWVDLGGWLYTKMVYLSAVTHPSSNWAQCWLKPVTHQSPVTTLGRHQVFGKRSVCMLLWRLLL